MKQSLIFSVVIAALIGLGAVTTVRSLHAEQVYGWQLMNEQERQEHQEKMRNLKTEKEREQYQREHHVKMQERAKLKGMTLPDEPGMQGKGMGPGQGMGSGQGMGPGHGMGSGKGR